MVTLREITKENHIECIKLKVKFEQEGFVASNAVSLAQSMFNPSARPLAIYSDETMVGFLMTCIDEDDGNYWIWRFMVDARYQSKGYGREAMRLALETIRADRTHNKVLLSFEPENKAAEKLYSGFGFRHTGRIEDGEAVMQLDY